MRSLQKLYLAAFAAILCAAPLSIARAQTLISSTGIQDGEYVQLQGQGGQFQYIAWSQTQAYDNVDVSIALVNNNSSPIQAIAYITTNDGPGTTSVDEVTTPATFDIPTGENDVNVFSDLTLNANESYYVTFNALNDDTNGLVGFGSASGETPVYYTLGPGVAGIGVGGGTQTSSFLPASSITEITPRPYFVVSGNLVTSVVPESSSLALILPSVLLLAGLGLMARRRTIMRA